MPYTAEIHEKLNSFLEANNLSIPYFIISEEIGVCFHMPQKDLLHRAEASLRTNHRGSGITKQDLKSEFMRMLNNGIVQEITHQSLSEISKFLQGSNAGPEEPFSGLPRVGEIDFTTFGAELYLKLFKAVFSKGEDTPKSSFTIDEDASHRTIYGSDRSFACQGVYDFVCQNEEYRLIACEQAKWCGAFFDRWWLQHPDGWKIRMTVEKIDK